mmetsp:Transcript_1511/g.3893  ORF Transcript_1511/g.3893 Transcript_1511/m.3893 type:complete len:392 (+) Transcript_1511:876-2051(+)
MLCHVLEGVLVLRQALRRLAQKQTALAAARRGRPARQVPALLVRGGALAHLHQEGRARLLEVLQDAQVERRAQVVRVGHEEEAVAVGNVLVKLTAPGEGGVQVAVPGRVPLELTAHPTRPGGSARLRRVDRRPQRVRVHLGRHALHHLVPVRALAQRVLGREVRARGLGGGGAVEQREARRWCAAILRARLAHALHLRDDQVEERHVGLAHHEERLGALQPHAGAQPAVELEHHRLTHERPIRHLGQVRERRERRDGLDVRLGDRAGLAAEQLEVVALEGGDGGVGLAGGTHLRFKLGPRALRATSFAAAHRRRRRRDGGHAHRARRALAGRRCDALRHRDARRRGGWRRRARARVERAVEQDPRQWAHHGWPARLSDGDTTVHTPTVARH